MENLQYDVVIGQPTLVKIRSNIDLFRQIVKISYHGKTEILNLGYEQDFGDDTEDDFTSDSESEGDIGEDSDSEDFNGLVLAINEKEDGISANSEDMLVEEKLSHLDEVHD